MKHKYILFLLVFILLLSGCGNADADTSNTVCYYYMHNEVNLGADAKIIVPTTRETDINKDDYFSIIGQYLNGPTSYDCISPFPAGTTLEELNWDQNRVQIMLSPHITTLSGIDLIVACACLTKTVTELTNINTVQIRSSSGLLNGEQALILTNESFMFLDQMTPYNSVN